MTRATPIDVAYPSRDPDRDGIAGHTRQLVAHLPPGSRWVPGPGRASGAELVVQYNPFSWGRRGYAPGLVREIREWKRADAARRVALLVHEPAVPLSSAANVVMGLWQRAQLRALVGASDRTFVTVRWWRDFLGGRGAEAAVVPVGSNLPLSTKGSVEARSEIGCGPDDLVVVSMGTGHPSSLRAHIGAAVERLADHHQSVVFLNLGNGAPSARGAIHSAVRVVEPGFLPAKDLATHLAAADLALLPYLDGASTRRTSLMAALQHGVPVLTTRGRATDPVALPAGALAYAADARPESFAERAVSLAGDSKARTALGAAGAEIHASRFAWPTIAADLVRMMNAT